VREWALHNIEVRHAARHESNAFDVGVCVRSLRAAIIGISLASADNCCSQTVHTPTMRAHLASLVVASVE
jgi:hypothetical protein